ncbi:NAD(+) synthase [uncultured Tyzzerella sp.]|uniref:NAD(+) synthase n=1 Tax=uncultured Tyzzerella sp. TaxID=2321398 RepID=UPI002942AF91|nr:NAD(+) synthase [uncultured Tyzzerella sp.]
MDYGFVRVAAATPCIKVADCFYNAKNIIEDIKKAQQNKTSIICFPELCITGYTCSDLFLQDSLLQDSINALKYIIEETKSLNITCIVGMPVEFLGSLYNCAVCFYKGKILGIVPKTHIPNYNEFYEKRHFNSLDDNNKHFVNLDGIEACFGKTIFKIENTKNFTFAIEICEDLWSVIPPSSNYVLNGTNIIFNLSASNEIAGKSIYRKELVKNQSARCICAYVYANAGQGESTTDLVFSGHNLIYENGNLLNESTPFKNEIIYSDIDLDYINSERRKNTSFKTTETKDYHTISYKMENISFDLDRYVDPMPFVPKDMDKRDIRCKEIIDMQAYGLKKRIEHIGIKNVVIGISGGLDSTHALIVVNRTFELLGYDKKGIITVTMPCFGTTDRTYNNAKKLCEIIGTTLLEINIKAAVLKHFEDIKHNPDVHNVTYENSQARERTQILMDISNKYNGIVIGTGDLSELALGFATYNGDHMSMYGVNGSIPKTLIRYLIEYFAKNSNINLKNILMDILNTPVSPELLPPNQNGNISQITEDIVGPYELHDFFLYNMIRYNYTPEKIYYLAKKAFKNTYNNQTILKWLEKFYIRFFTQQFKRSCLPDGVKVGSVSLSPRGDFRMPSDASFNSFLERIKNLEL